MSDPTVRDLLDSFASCKDEDRSLAIFEAEQLAARVERVLAEIETWKDHPGAARQLAHKIERLLNGKKL